MDRVDDGIAASEVEGKQEEGGEEGPQAATGAAEKGEAASSEGKGEEEKPLAEPTEQSPPTDTSGGSAAVKRRERLWTTDPSAGVDLAMGPEGIQADRPLTVGKMMQETVARFPQREALRHKAGDEWKAITYKEYYELSVKAAKSFLKLGLEPMHAVAFIGFNSPEYVIADIGAIFAGGLVTGMFLSSSADACLYIVHNSRANIVLVEDQTQLEKILEIRDKLPHLKAIVQYKGKLSQEYENVYDWEQFMELGKDMESSEIEQRIAEQKPEQCAIITYTSGTTGNPKGVMLSHDNLTWTAKSIHTTCLPVVGFGVDHVVSYLPLSHQAAQMADIFISIYCGATVHFANPDALKGSLVLTLREARPTYMFGVPRVWEKIKEAMDEQAVTVTGLKRKLINWAKRKGLEGNQRLQRNVQAKPRGWKIANRLVFKKVQRLLGFERCRLFLTGSAPVHLEVLEFFMSLDIPLLEVYGLTETTTPYTLNLLSQWRVGSVGRPMAGTQAKVLDQPDEGGEGEIMSYGRNTFMGYLFNEEKTREVFDGEGWLHSGDLGRMEDGYVYITGRIKELIITSGGKNIPPVPIEDAIKKELPFLSNVMLIGDKRKYLSCLVTLKCVMNPETGEPTDELLPQAKQAIAALGSKCTTVTAIVDDKDSAVMEAIQKGLDKVNSNSHSDVHKVKKFTILHEDFSVPGGELGPTLKVKRQSVVSKHKAVIEGIYMEEQDMMKSISFALASNVNT